MTNDVSCSSSEKKIAGSCIVIFSSMYKSSKPIYLTGRLYNLVNGVFLCKQFSMIYFTSLFMGVADNFNSCVRVHFAYS